MKINQTHGRVEYNGQRSKDGIYRIPDTLYKDNKSHSSHLIYLIVRKYISACINNQHVKPFFYVFQGEIQNILDPLEVSVSVELEDDVSSRNKDSSTDMFCTSCVVINKFLSKTEDLVKLPFVMDCGKDEICISDLKITLSIDKGSNANRCIIGSLSTIALRIDVHNQGEAAYEAKVHIFIETLSLASIPPECIENSRTSYILHVVCNVGNPLRTHV